VVVEVVDRFSVDVCHPVDTTVRLSHGQNSTSSPKRPEQKQSTPPSSHERGPQYTCVEIQSALGI
jgi:hypothetical protein